MPRRGMAPVRSCGATPVCGCSLLHYMACDLVRSVPTGCGTGSRRYQLGLPMVLPSPALLTTLITKFELFHSSMCRRCRNPQTHRPIAPDPHVCSQWPRSNRLSVPLGTPDLHSRIRVSVSVHVCLWVCACVRACVGACVRACACACHRGVEESRREHRPLVVALRSRLANHCRANGGTLSVRLA